MLWDWLYDIYFLQGSVEKLLKEKGPLEEPVVQKFTRQLLDAVAFLHNIPTNPVIHKDIKGQISSLVPSVINY